MCNLRVNGFEVHGSRISPIPHFACLVICPNVDDLWSSDASRSLSWLVTYVLYMDRAYVIEEPTPASMQPFSTQAFSISHGTSPIQAVRSPDSKPADAAHGWYPSVRDEPQAGVIISSDSTVYRSPLAEIIA
ncbi:hypothetical protein Hypma_010679 [Hypsizygus marmoreus]|uniref:Uncharacterized protein n=1 Tax=Hypsizygus marmoreus TaxID=39966 RepID=A0A369JP48_HYPMA|nr:hypothetical protein Hypma_010679 [Hypsizygus marmoreus]